MTLMCWTPCHLMLAASPLSGLGKRLTTAEWVADTLIPMVVAGAGLVLAFCLVQHQIRKDRELVTEQRRRDFANNLAVQLRQLGADLESRAEKARDKEASEEAWAKWLAGDFRTAIFRMAIAVRQVSEMIGGESTTTQINRHLRGVQSRWSRWATLVQENEGDHPMRPLASALSFEAKKEKAILESIASRLELWTGAEDELPDLSGISLAKPKPSKLEVSESVTEEQVQAREEEIEVWTKTQDAYFTEQAKPFVSPIAYFPAE